MGTWEIVGIILSLLFSIIMTLREANSKFDGGEINEFDRMYYNGDEPENLIETVTQGFNDGKRWMGKRNQK